MKQSWRYILIAWILLTHPALAALLFAALVGAVVTTARK